MLKKLIARIKITFCCGSKCSLNEDKVKIDIDGDGKTDVEFDIKKYQRRSSF